MTEYSQSHREEQVPSNAYGRPGLEGDCKITRQRRVNQKQKKKAKPNQKSVTENEPAKANSKIHTKSTGEKQPTKAIIGTSFHLEIKLILLNNLTKV